MWSLRRRQRASSIDKFVLMSTIYRLNCRFVGAPGGSAPGVCAMQRAAVPCDGRTQVSIAVGETNRVVRPRHVRLGVRPNPHKNVDAIQVTDKCVGCFARAGDSRDASAPCVFASKTNPIARCGGLWRRGVPLALQLDTARRGTNSATRISGGICDEST